MIKRNKELQEMVKQYKKDQKTQSSNKIQNNNLQNNINNLTNYMNAAKQVIEQQANQKKKDEKKTFSFSIDNEYEDDAKKVVSLPFKSNSIIAIDKDAQKKQAAKDLLLKNNQKFETLEGQLALKDKKGNPLPQLPYNNKSKDVSLGETIYYGLEGTPLGGMLDILGGLNDFSQDVNDELAGVAWNAARATGELGESVWDAYTQFATSDLNPYYLFNKDKQKAHQDIADELAAANATQTAIDKSGLNVIQDYVNENSALFNEDSIGGRVVREATKMLIEAQLTPGMSGSTTGTKLFSKAGAKQFGKKALGMAGTMGISAYGNAVEQAYKNGATREQATKYGIMSAALEVSTEMMFAGIAGIKGTSPADEFIQEKIASKFGNKFRGKVLSKVADILGEETEELVSWGIDPLLQKMTYAADKEWGELYDFGELGDTAIETGLTVLLLGTIPSNAEDSRKKIRQQYLDYYMESHEGATKKEAKEAFKRAEKEAEKVAKQAEKLQKQQDSKFKDINDEVNGKKFGEGISLDEIIREVDPELGKQLDEAKSNKEQEKTSEETTEKIEQPTEKPKTSLTEIVDEQEGKTLPKKETTETVKEEKVEEPKKDFNEQVKDIAKQYDVDAKALKSSGIKDIDKIETVAKAMNKQNYNTTVKDLAKKYGVGVSVLKSTKITDAKELESVAKTLSTKTEAEIEAPKKAKELPKKETKQVKTEETKVEKVKTEKLPEPTEATQEDIDHLFKKTPHMTEGEKQAKTQTKTQNKNQLYESAKYFNEQGSTLGAKFNIKNSDIQKALDIYVQYKEAGGKKTIENLEVLRKKPSVVKKAKENEEKTKTLPKKEQSVSKKDFADKLTALMDVQKAMDEDTEKSAKLPKAISVENTQTKKAEKVAKETKKTTKPVEEVKATKKSESLPKTDEQIDAEIKEMAQKGVTTTKADINTRQMFMESRARTLDRQISNMRSSGNTSDINTFIDNNIKQYEQLLADGGKKIPAYEEFKTKYRAEQTIEKLKGKTTIAAASSKTPTLVIKDIDKALNKKSNTKNIDKPLNIDDVASNVKLYGSDIAVDEPVSTPKNSEILVEHGKLPNKKTEVDKDIKLQLKAQLINQQAAIEKMDRKNRNYEGEQALAQYRVSPSEGAAQVTSAQTNLSADVVGKSILQIRQETYDGLNKDAKQIYEIMANLKRDVGFQEHADKYNEYKEYADNIFPEYSLEQKKEMLKALQNAYPALNELQEQAFEDIRKYYRNENTNLVESGYYSKTANVPVEYARNEIGMTKEEIDANRNKDGSVKVPTVDFYAAMNPYYFHVSRLVDMPSGGVSTTKTSVSVKGPQGLKKDANRYAIQPMFDGMADGAIKNRVMMRENQLLATIAKNDKSFENNQVPPTDIIKEDEYGNTRVIKAGKNEYYIRYRENGKYKAAKINKSMYDAISNNTTFVDEVFKNTTTGKLVKATNKLEKQLLTTLNPDFVIKNTARDLGEALLNTNYNDAVFTAEYLKSVWDIASNNDLWQKFKNAGLFQSDGYYVYSTKKGFEKQNAVVRNTIGRMEDVAAWSEALPRFTEFKLALRKGQSLSEAIRQAKRVTVDFSRRGKAIGVMDRNFSKFVGAAEAGMNTMYDNIIGNNIYSAQTIMRKLHGEELTSRDIQTLKKSGRTMARIAMSSMIPSLYNSLAFGSGDDKEWLENNVPEYIRNNAYIIRIGKSDVYIPLYYARSQSVYKKAVDEMLNKDSLGDKVSEISKSFADNIAPNNPIETSSVYEMFNWFQNKDYYGNKIYEDDDTLLEKMRKVGLKEAKSYGGLVYDVYDWATSSEKDSPSKMPIVNTLVKDANTLSGVKQQSYNYSTKFWNKKEEYENSKDEKKNIIAKSMYADYKEYVKPIADQIKIAKETGASDKELKKLYAKQRDTYRSILEDEDKVYHYDYDEDYYYYKGNAYKYTVDKNGKVSYRKQK